MPFAGRETRVEDVLLGASPCPFVETAGGIARKRHRVTPDLGRLIQQPGGRGRSCDRSDETGRPKGRGELGRDDRFTEADHDLVAGHDCSQKVRPRRIGGRRQRQHGWDHDHAGMTGTREMRVVADRGGRERPLDQGRQLRPDAGLRAGNRGRRTVADLAAERRAQRDRTALRNGAEDCGDAVEKAEPRLPHHREWQQACRNAAREGREGAEGRAGAGRDGIRHGSGQRARRGFEQTPGLLAELFAPLLVEPRLGQRLLELVPVGLVEDQAFRLQLGPSVGCARHHVLPLREGGIGERVGHELLQIARQCLPGSVIGKRK